MRCAELPRAVGRGGIADDAEKAARGRQLIAIRDFAATDRRALAAILDAASRVAFPWARLPLMDEGAFDRATQGEDILVAELDGTPAAFAAIWAPEKFLHHLYVAPAAHRAGVGRALVEAVIARHGRALSLKCVERNLPARAFYKALGWIETDEPGGADMPTGNWMHIRTPEAAAALGLAARAPPP